MCKLGNIVLFSSRIRCLFSAFFLLFGLFLHHARRTRRELQVMHLRAFWKSKHRQKNRLLYGKIIIRLRNPVFYNSLNRIGPPQVIFNWTFLIFSRTEMKDVLYFYIKSKSEADVTRKSHRGLSLKCPHLVWRQPQPWISLRCYRIWPEIAEVQGWFQHISVSFKKNK